MEGMAVARNQLIFHAGHEQEACVTLASLYAVLSDLAEYQPDPQAAVVIANVRDAIQRAFQGSAN
jgi:hypothetical protein